MKEKGERTKQSILDFSIKWSPFSPFSYVATVKSYKKMNPAVELLAPPALYDTVGQ